MLQSSLGQKALHLAPKFDHFKIAKVTSTHEFDTKGRIDVQFQRGGAPVPVQVVENLGTTVPEQGDWVVIGYIEESKHRPFLVGYIKDLFRTSDILRLSKDFIEIKFPAEFDLDTHEKEFKHFVIRIEMPDPNSDDPKTPKVIVQMPDTVEEDPTRVTITNELVQVESADVVRVIAKGNLEGSVKGDVILQVEGNADLQVKGDLKALTEKNAEVKASANLTAEAGANAKVKAGANADIEAGGALNLTGSVINLN